MSLTGLLTTAHPVGNQSIDDILHPYWKQWDIENMIPDSWHYAVAAWMTFFGILGVSGNLLVIWTFLKTKSLRTAPNMLLVNLALGDMCFSAVNGFPLLTISSINKRWVWGRLFCEIYGFVGGIFGLMSINTLAWIAIDRFYVITNPLNAAQTMTKKRAFIILMVIWANSALWSVPPFFGWGAYVPEGFQTSCTFDYLTQTMNNYTFVIGMYMFGFIFPVAIIFFCYLGIVRAIFAHHAEMMATASRMGATATKADADKKSEIQIAKVAAITIGTFMLSWTPYAIVGVFGMIKPHSEMFIHPLLSEIPVMLAKASAAYNPVIYALSHPRFRAEIDKHFPWLLACCKPKPKATLPSSTTKGSIISKTEAETSVSNVTEVEMAEPAANPSA